MEQEIRSEFAKNIRSCKTTNTRMKISAQAKRTVNYFFNQGTKTEVKEKQLEVLIDQSNLGKQMAVKVKMQKWVLEIIRRRIMSTKA